MGNMVGHEVQGVGRKAGRGQACVVNVVGGECAGKAEGRQAKATNPGKKVVGGKGRRKGEERHTEV